MRLCPKLRFESLAVSTGMGAGCSPAVGSDTKGETKVKQDSGIKESDPLRDWKIRDKAVFI